MEKTFTIAEVSKLFSINESTLRYYESAGLMEPVFKNDSGHRRYTEIDLRRVRFIRLLRNGGVPIHEIKHYVDLVYDGEQTIPERKQLLIDQLASLQEKARLLNQSIADLQDIISNYEDTLVKRELDNRRADKNAYKKPQ